MTPFPPTLAITLHGLRIGTLAWLEGDRSIFSFDPAYVADEQRATLSLAYRDEFGGLIDQPHSYQTKIEPFFSNLLPEGELRRYLAQQSGVKPSREYPLLAILGRDLPGAVQALPIEDGDPLLPDDANANPEPTTLDDQSLRFSLAGVQLKFSALRNQRKGGGLTIPTSGMGGDWIVKLPSAQHVDVPENEFAVMKLAALLGIDVPEVELVPLEEIRGLPEAIHRYGTHAYAIRRFDRSADGPVHIEDFAQVFGVYGDAKYEKASYLSILKVLAQVSDERSVTQFIQRLTFNVLIGNGDMHLKNWSLIYPDQRTPQLSPAYDLLCTLPYIAGDVSALNFYRSKAWESFDYETLAIMADKARLPTHFVTEIARDMVARFDALWPDARGELPFPDEVRAAIDTHRGRVVL